MVLFVLLQIEYTLFKILDFFKLPSMTNKTQYSINYRYCRKFENLWFRTQLCDIYAQFKF